MCRPTGPPQVPDLDQPRRTGSEFVFVPASEFIMGNDDGDNKWKAAQKVLCPDTGSGSMAICQFRSSWRNRARAGGEHR